MTDHSDWKPGLTHIGTQKQLFLDDYMVESLKNAVFEMNPTPVWPADATARRMALA